MLEPGLHYRSALAGFMQAGRSGQPSGPAGVVVREIPRLAVTSIMAGRGRSGATVVALSRLFGAAVIDGPKRSVRDGLSVCGIAPGQWLAIERGPGRAGTTALRGGLADCAAVVDQSDSRFVLEISGPSVRSALVKGIPVDLDPRVFTPGCVAQTMAGHIGLQIAAMTEQPGDALARDGSAAYELVSAASTAGSFWSWLAGAAAEFGLDVRGGD